MRRVSIRPRRWSFGATGRPAAFAGAGERAGGAFLPGVFADARQSVEMAFGADLNAPPATWPWVEVTPYFKWDPGVITTIGYGNESTGLTPASFTGRIKNNQGDGGWFTMGNPLSPFWPNIRENTPVRSRIDVGNGPSDRFFGYATKWEPVRNAAGALNEIRFEAHGVTRRLRQGKSAQLSPMYRFHMLSYRFPTSTNLGWPDGDQQYHSLPAHYWPLDERAGALRGANVIDPTAPLVAEGATRVPQFGGDAFLPGAGSLTRFPNGTSLSAIMPLVRPGGTIEASDTDEEGIRVQILVRLDESTQTSLRDALGTLADGITARLLTVRPSLSPAAGDVQQVVIYFDNDATNGLLLYADTLDSRGISVIGSAMGGEVGIPWERGVYVTLDFVQTMAGIEIRFGAIPLTVNPSSGAPTDEVVGIYDLQSLTPGSLYGLTEVLVAEGGFMHGGAIGQLSVYNGVGRSFPDRYPHALLGRTGDSVATRLSRLGIEQNVAIEIVGDASDIPMGPQGTAGFLSLVDEAVAVDQGLLLDGLTSGLLYVTRQAMYSQTPGVTFDSSDGDELGPSEPAHDDQGRVNDYTASSPSGESQRFVQTEGDLGTDTVGTYDSGNDHKAALGSDLYQIAAWKVGIGTTPGLRYPRFRFQLAKPVTAPKAQQWLDVRPGAHFRILDAQPGMPDPHRSQLLRGWREHRNSLFWEVTANMGVHDPYAITVLADDADTDSDFLGWLETDDGTVTTGDTAAGALDESDFEDGTVGNWTATGATPGVTSSNAHSGSWSMTGSVTGSPSQAILRSGRLTVTPGRLYGASIWLRSPGGYDFIHAAIDWYDSGGGYLSTTSGTIAEPPAGTWTRYVVAGVAPAGAVGAEYGPTLTSNPPNGTFINIDDGLFGAALSVVTAPGTLLTHDALSHHADDVDGLYVNAAGLKLQVLGITGAMSPQTMIIDPTGLLKALPPGSSITAWNPARLGL